MVPLAPKLKVKVIAYHYFISYRRKSVPNLLVEIQNTFVLNRFKYLGTVDYERVKETLAIYSRARK